MKSCSLRCSLCEARRGHIRDALTFQVHDEAMMCEKVRSYYGGSNVRDGEGPRECAAKSEVDGEHVLSVGGNVEPFAAVSWSAPGGDFCGAYERGSNEITDPESIRNLIPAFRS